MKCSYRNYPQNGGEVQQVYSGWLGFYSHNVGMRCVNVVKVILAKQSEILLRSRQGTTSLCRDMCQVLDRPNPNSVSCYYIATIMEQVRMDVYNMWSTLQQLTNMEFCQMQLYERHPRLIVGAAAFCAVYRTDLLI